MDQAWCSPDRMMCCHCVQDDLMDAAEVKDMLDVAGHVKVRPGCELRLSASN
jgi:hypothetical protein